MKALSIALPNRMITQSTEAANELGISRTAFIKLAIAHELKRLAIEKKQRAMGHALAQMHNNPDYLKEAQRIENEFAEDNID